MQFELVDKFINYAKENLELDESNAIYCQNALLEIFGDQEIDADQMPEEISDKVYGTLSLMPDKINAKFQSLVAKDTKQATDWFYNYCVKNNYVKKAILDKNPRFDSEGLVITINKAKPEFRDPKKAQSGNSVAGGYP
jgi:UDPglucose--hexose-1-phosphate uridylyltransferase